MTAPDDLAGLFAPAPAQPSQDMRFRQGTVISWDPVTLANSVSVGGAVLTNLPVLGVGEAILIQPGSVVGIVSFGAEDSGARTMAIIGRLVIPDTQQATDATALLSSLTAANIVLPQESTSSNSFGNLTTFGPSVTVTVRDTGRLLVTMGMWIQWGLTPPPTGGEMGLNMSGANTLSPAPGDDTTRDWLGSTAAGSFTRVGNPSVTRVYEGLNSGPTTLWATYRSSNAGVTVDISRRFLVVQVL